MGDSKKSGSSGTYHWCRSCKFSHMTPLNQHNHSPQHLSKLLKYLERQYEKIKAAKHFLSHPSKVDPNFVDKNFWCFCCDRDIDNSKNTFICFETLKHLQSKEHVKKVDSFWNDTAAYLLKNKLQKPKKKFLVANQQYRQFIRLIKDYSEEKEEEPPLKQQDIENMIQHSHIDEPTQTEESPKTSKVYKTVANEFGILQNPTGFHNGERVWGGGIVKYKDKDEWIPWSIDLDDESDTFEGLPKSQPELLGDLEENVSLMPKGKRTVQVSNHNLTSLPPLELLPGEGNIYTGATPPWLLDAQGNLKVINGQRKPQQKTKEEMEKIRRENRRRKNKKNHGKPQKLGHDLDRSSLKKGSNFLPNFGGVWNYASRSEARRQFREQQQETKQTPSDPLLSTIEPEEDNIQKIKKAYGKVEMDRLVP